MIKICKHYNNVHIYSRPFLCIYRPGLYKLNNYCHKKYIYSQLYNLEKGPYKILHRTFIDTTSDSNLFGTKLVEIIGLKNMSTDKIYKCSMSYISSDNIISLVDENERQVHDFSNEIDMYINFTFNLDLTILIKSYLYAS